MSLTLSPLANRAHLRTTVRAVAAGTIAAALLDAANGVVTYTVVLKSLSIVGVLQYIASGLLGRAAFSGGLGTAALGLLIHFAISLFFAATYVLAATRFPVLRRAPFVAGPFYGAAIWVLMNVVVLPLSATVATPVTLPLVLAGIIGHALFVGTPIAYAAARFLNGERA